MIAFTAVPRDPMGHPDRSSLSERELLAHIAFLGHARCHSAAKRLGSSVAAVHAAECDRIQHECEHRFAFATKYPHPRIGMVREYVCLCCNLGLLRMAVRRAY